MLVGLLAHTPPTSILLTSASSLVLLTAALQTSLHSTNELFVESLVLGSQLILVAGLIVFVRRRLGPRASNVLADGLIVGLGAWVLIWVVLVQPAIQESTSSSLTVLRASTLGAAMVVLFLLATLLFSDTAPSPAVGFLGLAVFLGLIGIVLRAMSFRQDFSISSTTFSTPFLVTGGFAAAGFLHPTVRHIYTSGAGRVSPPLMTRLVTTTASLIVPVVLLAVTDPFDTQDRVVRTLSVSVLAVVVMLRVIQSVRANARTQEHLVKSALTDSLTGLPNRILMLEHIETAVQQAWRTSRQPTVLFIDVDRFKNINDSLGHSIGDNVLTLVASRLIAAVPEHATVARIAGDEFVILDATTESPTQSVLLAETVLDAFHEPVSTPEGDMFVTASIGIAYSPKGVDLSADDLMRHADTAMYRAKAAGRNCIALFDDSMLEKVSKRLDVETALYRALERKELHLVHQPIIDVDLGIVVGFEALMRWDRGDGEIVPPSDFIPIAEETGTIVPLGSWALNDALLQLRHWIDTAVVSPSTTMSVNVSPRQLHDPQFVSIVSDALSTSGIPAEQLWLEVTESVMITEATQALSALRRLNALGVRIAIDDFGTGYSSLSLLQKFPIQCVKIDRAFVQDLTTEEGTRNLVRTIIAMANALGADIVAEGIENKDQLTALASMRCNKAQGYFISRPIAVADVPAVVQQLQDIDAWRARTSF
jgi:diguanylate cyclase (GGDEF)-like protein